MKNDIKESQRIYKCQYIPTSMPSEPSGSDISGFVDLPTSPTNSTDTDREESSTFHLFLWIFMRVYPVWNGLRNNSGSTQITLSRLLHELVTM